LPSPPRGRIPRDRRGALALTAAALAFIAYETLAPAPENIALVARTPIWCVVCGELGLVDVLLNVLLFVPLGLGLRLLGHSWGRTVLLGAALSLAIETAQYFAIPGRDASLGDLLTNTLGAGLGALLATTWRIWATPRPTDARTLTLLAAVIWLAQVAASGEAVRPALPQSVYWGQRTAELGQFDTFPGQLLDARVGALSLPSHRLPNSDEVREALLNGTTLTAVAVPAGPTNGIAPIVSIFDGQQREIAVLGQFHDDLVYRLRSRATDWRLRPPAIRLRSVFRSVTPETVTVAGAIRSNRFVVEATGPAGREARVLPLSAQWGWGLLLPFEYAFGPEVEWASALWVAGWLVPIGFWLCATRIRIGPAVGVITLLLLLGLAALPGLLLESTAPPEWVGGLAGAGVGWGVSRLVSAWAAPVGARHR
jgi:hypothetical protein